MGWGFMAAVFFLSLTPTPPLQFDFHWSDKLEHALAYGLLMAWFMQIYSMPRQRTLVAFALIAFGVLMEFLQARGGTRVFDLVDMVANSVGVLLVWVLLPRRGAELLCRLERSFVGA